MAIHRAERQTFGARGQQGWRAIDVELDLRPLAKALQYMGQGSEHYRNKTIARAINRGLEKFKAAAHVKLKQLTKIKRPSRLKKGVTIQRAHEGSMVGRYIITDRNIRITKAYFSAGYSNYGVAGGRARRGQSFSPKGATWTSWDGTRTGKSTFMIRGKAPVLIRLGHAKRTPLMPVFGPNPSEMVRLHAGEFTEIMRASANAYLQQAVTRSYRESEAKAKRMFGL